MPKLFPVVESLPHDYSSFDLWPFRGYDGEWIPLHREVPSDDVGAVVLSLLGHSTSGELARPDLVTAFDELVRLERTFLPGGLQLEADGIAVTPGCCADLTDWPDWYGLPDGEAPDLGHGPGSVFEFDGEIIRFWPDADDEDWGSPEGRRLEVRRQDIPGLLQSVDQDLAGFIDALRAWVRNLEPSRADPVVAAVSGYLRVGKCPST
ncbi:hypothetical protein ACFORH_12305 [Amycolatopsis roodepoortensis]|uniref:SUKH-4 immunity protein of toxin-antitoxin system n=1 Tax=Amycolatopsis roodepoortensis TaxID=700274 RepID=A0ABR9L0B0_9PSEU|nr:hypothetical protein [Amycolatopsis roodepoortensis]MBE1574028.1 hypothetical protein [Amycolatopsis roodepoortensis]